MAFPQEQLQALINHFAAKRQEILSQWRSRVQHDGDLSSPMSLPRIQFLDHIPAVLKGFEASLQAGDRGAIDEAERRGETGAEHGIHRWQQGYDLHEVMREWGHLHHCLVDELENYASAHPEVDRMVIGLAHRTLTVLFSQGIEESTQNFVRMQRAEAAGQLKDLARAVHEGQKFQQRQSEILREATHDLRGQLGIVTSAAEVLSYDDLPQETRTELRGMLQRSLARQNELFNELMDLARLQAGQERRTIESVDIAERLRQLSESVRPLAQQRNLTLTGHGPENLLVECDSNHVCRIAQNLLLNAIKYTNRGGVVISWGESRNNDPNRWMLSVEDTGPGFHAGPGGPLATALKEATQESQEVETKNRSAGGATDNDPKDHRAERQVAGEGIGLSIVKRLCELLDASIEMESEISKGTIFRILFPRQYPK